MNVLGIFRKAAPKVAPKVARLSKRGAVKTADALAGKVKTGLVQSSPEIDKFIKSCEKQGATIVDDSVVLLRDGLPGTTYRVITKRLPSGTTVSNVYDRVGIPNGKLVRSMDGSSSVTSIYGSGNASKYFLHESRDGKQIFGAYGEVVDTTYVPIDLNRTLLSRPYDAATLALKSSENYSALSDMGLVKKPKGML